MTEKVTFGDPMTEKVTFGDAEVAIRWSQSNRLCGSELAITDILSSLFY